MRARRMLVDDLTDIAVTHAAAVSPSPEQHRNAIAATWEAAAGDGTLREEVVAGHLSAGLTPSDGLGDSPAGGTAPAHQPAAAVGEAPSARRAALPRDELALRRAEEALAEARRELADAVATETEADDDVADAEPRGRRRAFRASARPGAGRTSRTGSGDTTTAMSRRACDLVSATSRTGHSSSGGHSTRGPR